MTGDRNRTTIGEDLEILDRLIRFERAVIDGTVHDLGSVREQLAEHARRQETR